MSWDDEDWIVPSSTEDNRSPDFEPSSPARPSKASEVKSSLKSWEQSLQANPLEERSWRLQSTADTAGFADSWEDVNWDGAAVESSGGEQQVFSFRSGDDLAEIPSITKGDGSPRIHLVGISSREALQSSDVELAVVREESSQVSSAASANAIPMHSRPVVIADSSNGIASGDKPKKISSVAKERGESMIELEPTAFTAIRSSNENEVSTTVDLLSAQPSAADRRDCEDDSSTTVDLVSAQSSAPVRRDTEDESSTTVDLLSAQSSAPVRRDTEDESSTSSTVHMIEFPNSSAHPSVLVSGLVKGTVDKYEGGIKEEDDLGLFFYDRACSVLAVTLFLNPDTGESEGCGMVEFEDVESQLRAIDLEPQLQRSSLAPLGGNITIRKTSDAIADRAAVVADPGTRTAQDADLERHTSWADSVDDWVSRNPSLNTSEVDCEEVPEWRRQRSRMDTAQECMAAHSSSQERRPNRPGLLEDRQENWRCPRMPGNRCRPSHIRGDQVRNLDLDWRQRDTDGWRKEPERGLESVIEERAAREKQLQAEIAIDVPEWRQRPGPCVPEWRRRPQRPLLQKDGVEFVQWLLNREVKARLKGFPDIAIRAEESYSVRDGGCQTEIQSNPCAVCLSATRTRVCVPCGHFCLCEYCARKQGRRGYDTCPLCRQPALLVLTINVDLTCESGAKSEKLAKQELAAIPEWRRQAIEELAVQKGHRKQARRLQSQALEDLQALLFANTVKSMKPQKSCETSDVGCQANDISEMCVICGDKPRAYAALPCCHFCLCLDCTTGLDDCAPCPVCRVEAQSFLRIFQ